MADTTRTGGGYSRAPAHQNRFAYKHNKNSKTTKRILGISHHGLCERCSEQIEWRKNYRKYKPLKAPAKCRGCDQKNVKRAYHTLCPSCAGGKSVCAKCVKPLSALSLEEVEARKQRHNASKLESLIEGMREREKRAIRRKMENGELRVETEDGVNFQLVEQERPVEEAGEDDDAEDGSAEDGSAEDGSAEDDDDDDDEVVDEDGCDDESSSRIGTDGAAMKEEEEEPSSAVHGDSSSACVGESAEAVADEVPQVVDEQSGAVAE
jgi:hypothetical protein